MSNPIEINHGDKTPTKFDFFVDYVTTMEATEFLSNNHYLGDKWRPCYNYGLYVDPVTDGLTEVFSEPILVGVCIFGSAPSKEVLISMLGSDYQKYPSTMCLEMSRLCIDPRFQKGGEYYTHNIASWFASQCMKMLKKRVPEVQLVLSYAQADVHNGVIYQAMNFNYYGTTPKKNDFWELKPNGTYIKVSRGTVRGLTGEWRPRPVKHRYVYRYPLKKNEPRPVIVWKRLSFDSINANAVLSASDIPSFKEFVTAKGYTMDTENLVGDYEIFRLLTPDYKILIAYYRTRSDEISTSSGKLTELINEWYRFENGDSQ